MSTAPCLSRLPTALPVESGGRGTMPRHGSLLRTVHEPWTVRVGRSVLLVRPTTTRDLPRVAALHGRCSARTLLDRYRAGGRAPSVAAVEQSLRRHLGFAAVTADGRAVGTGVVSVDAAHGQGSAEVGVLVEDAWQGRGLGRALLAHLAGAAVVLGHAELTAYPGTSVGIAQRLSIEIGRTRWVNDPRQPHLHTQLGEPALLGLGAVRERLAG